MYLYGGAEMTSGTKFTVFFIILLVFGCIAFEWYKEILDIQAKRALANLKDCPCIVEVQK
jgi:hypothetical protein